MNFAGESRRTASGILSFLKLRSAFYNQSGFFFGYQAAELWGCCDKTAKERLKRLQKMNLVTDTGVRKKDSNKTNYLFKGFYFTSLTRLKNPSFKAVVIPSQCIMSSTVQAFMGLCNEVNVERYMRTRTENQKRLTGTARKSYRDKKFTSSKYFSRPTGQRMKVCQHKPQTNHFVSNRFASDYILKNVTASTVLNRRKAQKKVFDCVTYTRNIRTFEQVYDIKLKGYSMSQLQEIADQYNMAQKFNAVKVDNIEHPDNVGVANLGFYYVSRKYRTVIVNRVSDRETAFTENQPCTVAYSVKPFNRGGFIRDRRRFAWKSGVVFDRKEYDDANPVESTELGRILRFA